MKNETAQIGASLLRADAENKVRGQERYAADYYPEGMLWAGVKRSEYAHARIMHIDVSRAAKMPGIISVLTSKDVNGTNRVGVPSSDQPVLADDKVRTFGDAVALVVAEDKKALQAAILAIRVDYEVLPGIFDPEEAMKPDAPLVHDGRKDGNVLLHGAIKRGAGAEAFLQCSEIVEGVFYMPCQEHAYLETEAGIARMDEDGTLEIIASTQTPFRDRAELAHALGLPMSKVRVIAPYLGGGFGGKDGISVQGLLGVAALHSGGRPVKMWNSREESFISSSKRHPATVHFRLGAQGDGTLHALDCKIVLDTGAYAALGTAVLALAMEHAAGVYRIPNVEVEGDCVYTNNPTSGAFRGFGAPQVLGGLEQLMDMLALKLNMDSLELRLKNAVNRGDEIGSGVLMSHSTGIIPCLKQVQAHPLWRSREKWEQAAPLHKRRGVGIAAGLQGTGYGPVVPDAANARIELLQNGRFRIYCGVSDMGQGNNSTNAQIAGEILCQPIEQFELLQPDTSESLPSGSSAASRTTFSYGNALKGAAAALKEMIIKRAASMAMGAYQEDMMLLPGKVCHLPSGREIPLELIASTMNGVQRCATFTYLAPVDRYHQVASPGLREAGFPHAIFSFGCHLARVEIDELTGESQVCDFLSCIDAGRVLNPQIYEQQVQGGVVQGLGYALFEDYIVADGETQSRNLTTYILPTAVDVPDIESIAVETVEEEGPYGMKGLGEIVIDMPFPAVANAIARATGMRIYKGPLSQERILNALEAGKKGAGK